MRLSILLDENVPPSVANFLLARRPNWIVTHVRAVGMRGASDNEVFAHAQRENAIVITFDEDFADARMYPVGGHAGVIRMRVWPTTTERAEAAIERLLATIDDDSLPGSLIIIDEAKIRIRRASQHG